MPDASVLKLLGVSRRTFYRRLADGVLTEPNARLAKNRRGWTLSDLELARQQLSDHQRKSIERQGSSSEEQRKGSA
jgi:predicted DNA-binding transcriptional regulator AlpA